MKPGSTEVCAPKRKKEKLPNSLAKSPDPLWDFFFFFQSCADLVFDSCQWLKLLVSKSIAFKKPQRSSKGFLWVHEVKKKKKSLFKCLKYMCSSEIVFCVSLE